MPSGNLQSSKWGIKKGVGEDALIENHVHVRLEAGKGVWSISPGLEGGLKEDTLGEMSPELSLKRLRKSLPGGQGQGEHTGQGKSRPKSIKLWNHATGVAWSSQVFGAVSTRGIGDELGWVHQH